MSLAKLSLAPAVRQFALGVLAVSTLAGCASEKAPAPGAYGVQGGFVAAAVADEPQAALIGRDILQQGGTAADAAVAMYFALAVTLPSQAALGGGGACLTYNTATDEARSLEFLARAPAQVPAGADRPTAIPGNVRGMFALHGIYGRLRWSQLVAPAENLAAFGMPVSRALATDLFAVRGALAAEPEVRRIFAGPNGAAMLDEGDLLSQPELASTLALIRTNGPAEFYSGKLSERLIAGARRAGGSLDAADLADYQPLWRKPLGVGWSDRKAYFLTPPPAGGGISGQTWAMLVKDDRWEDAPAAERALVAVEDARRSFGDWRKWGEFPADPQEIVSSARIDELLTQAEPAPARPPLPDETMVENPAAAGFLALDREGSVVSCSVTLNSLFGTGRVASGTGVVLAALPGPGGRGATMLGPMIVTEPRGRQFVYASASAGGVAAPTATATVAARALLGEASLEDAVAARRVHGGSDPGVVYAEPGVDDETLAVLANHGLQIVTTPKLGHIDAVLCPEGFRSSPELCTAVSDPRDFGLAVIVD